MAETPGIPSTKGFPAFGPSNSNVVERPSDGVPEGVITLTANWLGEGLPLTGSMMCPADSGPSNEADVCSDVETL